jgi:DNA-binding PadR family transcriptional regulator
MGTTTRSAPIGEPALHILLALGTEARHGYAVMQAAAERTGGQLRILPGTLYSTLKRLVADGLVEETDAPAGVESSDARRRYYRVTKAGRSVVREEMSRLALLVKLGKAFG